MTTDTHSQYQYDGWVECDVTIPFTEGDTLGIAIQQDMIVDEVDPSSRLCTAGITLGMKIVGVNGRRVTSDREAYDVVKSCGGPFLKLSVLSSHRPKEYYTGVQSNYSARVPRLMAQIATGTNDPKVISSFSENDVSDRVNAILSSTAARLAPQQHIANNEFRSEVSHAVAGSPRRLLPPSDFVYNHDVFDRRSSPNLRYKTPPAPTISHSFVPPADVHQRSLMDYPSISPSRRPPMSTPRKSKGGVYAAAVPVRGSTPALSPVSRRTKKQFLRKGDGGGGGGRGVVSGIPPSTPAGRNDYSGAMGPPLPSERAAAWHTL